MRKFLALVLALVMTMSLVTISAGAEDFTDADKVTYSEAVDVMTAAGVVSGYADGSFNPTAGLTRGAAAKIICNMILGPTTAEALSANDAPYSDVAVDNVFAGYIAYCANEGIISGYADGTFRPAAPLTGYAFMKMLLGALGYDAAIEGYTGSNWSIAVAKRALAVGLDKGLVDEFVGAKALNREEACLYAFNAMKADMVRYNQKSTISVGDLVITQNSEAVTYSDKNADKIWDENDDELPLTLQFAEKYFSDLSVVEYDETAEEPNVDAYGRPATTWYNDGDKIGTYAQEADFTYVNSYDKAAAKALTKADYVLNANTVVTYNGGSDEDVNINTLKDGDNAITGYTIEMYNTDKAKDIEVVVVIEEYFAQVGKFTAANAKKDTEAKVVLTVTEAIAGDVELTIVDDPDSDTDAYDKLAAYEKDDYVSVVAVPGWDGDNDSDAAFILAVNPVEAVEGKVQKVTDNGWVYESTIKMDGTTYKLNNECVGVVNCGTPVVATDEGTLYLDAQGCVIGWVAKDEAVSDKAIAVSEAFKSLEDGKLVDKVTGYLSNGETITLVVDGEYDEYAVYTYEDEDENGKKDGVYALTKLSAKTQAEVKDGATVYSAADIAANAKTIGKAYFAEDVNFIFVDATEGDEEITVKTGVQKVVADKEKDEVIDKFYTVEEVDEVLYVTAVYVMKAPAAGTATADSLVFVAGESTGTISIEIDEEDEDFNTYDAYIDGAEVEDFYSKEDIKAAGFYKNVKDEETGAYILDKEFTNESDDDIGVAIVTVTEYAAGVVNGTYGVAGVEVVDLSKNHDGIEAENGCRVAMIYDKETMNALYVYVLDAAK